MKSVVFVEVDLRTCALRYGETTGDGTCPAVLGVDSAAKCFNSPKTCPVRASFVDETVTLRFGEDNGILPGNIHCIKSLTGVAMSPGRISLGENLGVRASVTASFRDHPHGDAGPGFDKYLADRDYDSFARGTFWGRFAARHPYLQGQSLRVIRGFMPDSFSAEYPQGQALPDDVLVEQETRHYIIESLEELEPGAHTISIVAKDILKLADDDKALWPKTSNGRLASAITNSYGYATLTPTGIGDEEYPQSGYVVLGGQEVVAYERAGDILVITRAQKGTAAQAHSAGDRVQLTYSRASITPAQYLDDLFRLGAGIPDSFIPRTAWDYECETFLNRVYSMDIVEPTSVKTLASEMIQQAALAVWQDDQSQSIRIKVLRPIADDAAAFDDSNVLVDGNGLTTLRVTAQPDKRVSEVHTWFGQTNPTESVDDAKNYRASRSLADEDAADDWVTPAVRRYYSRLIPPLGAAAADRINEIVISRFRDPPRKFTFRSFARGSVIPSYGMECRIFGATLQDASGAAVSAPAVITRLRRDHAYFEVEAEEARGGAAPEDLNERRLLVDVNTSNVDLLAFHNTFYPPPETGDTFHLTLTIDSGVTLGSASAAIAALNIGTWPAGVTLTLELNGHLQGAGGLGGSNAAGQAGGTAIYTRKALEIIAGASNRIWGGGGGGGSVASLEIGGVGYTSGGGGAGVAAGAAGYPWTAGLWNIAYGANPGGVELGGGGTRLWYGSWELVGGRGGDAGQPGYDASYSGGAVPFAPGAAGKAIDGISYCTFSSSTGDRRGLEIN